MFFSYITPISSKITRFISYLLYLYCLKYCTRYSTIVLEDSEQLFQTPKQDYLPLRQPCTSRHELGKCCMLQLLIRIEQLLVKLWIISNPLSDILFPPSRNAFVEYNMMFKSDLLWVPCLCKCICARERLLASGGFRVAIFLHILDGRHGVKVRSCSRNRWLGDPNNPSGLWDTNPSHVNCQGRTTLEE